MVSSSNPSRDYPTLTSYPCLHVLEFAPIHLEEAKAEEVLREEKEDEEEEEEEEEWEEEIEGEEEEEEKAGLLHGAESSSACFRPQAISPREGQSGQPYNPIVR